MAASPEVRRYFQERILANTTREGPPPNFRALDVPPTGRVLVHACRHAGRNVLDVSVLVEGGRLADVRVACRVCNPTAYAAADIVADWARGQTLERLLAVDALDAAQLEPLWARLGGDGRPEDAREKLQYGVVAIQGAVRDAIGAAPLPVPAIQSGGDED